MLSKIAISPSLKIEATCPTPKRSICVPTPPPEDVLARRTMPSPVRLSLRRLGRKRSGSPSAVDDGSPDTQVNLLVHVTWRDHEINPLLRQRAGQSNHAGLCPGQEDSPASPLEQLADGNRSFRECVSSLWFHDTDYKSTLLLVTLEASLASEAEASWYSKMGVLQRAGKDPDVSSPKLRERGEVAPSSEPSTDFVASAPTAQKVDVDESSKSMDNVVESYKSMDYVVDESSVFYQSKPKRQSFREAKEEIKAISQYSRTLEPLSSGGSPGSNARHPKVTDDAAHEPKMVDDAAHEPKVADESKDETKQGGRWWAGRTSKAARESKPGILADLHTPEANRSISGCSSSNSKGSRSSSKGKGSSSGSSSRAATAADGDQLPPPVQLPAPHTTKLEGEELPTGAFRPMRTVSMQLQDASLGGLRTLHASASEEVAHAPSTPSTANAPSATSRVLVMPSSSPGSKPSGSSLILHETTPSEPPRSPDDLEALLKDVDEQSNGK